MPALPGALPRYLKAMKITSAPARLPKTSSA
jgi:hypothetical protein